MSEAILLWRGGRVVTVPRVEWEQGFAHVPHHMGAELAFMTHDHHLIRYFVVSELPRAGQPLSPEFISRSLNLHVGHVNLILDDLERHLTFLFRNEHGYVTWAYPVTVDETPHHVTFSSGDKIQAAWAVDAIATPFVQGRVREKEKLSFIIKTECAHCSQPITIEIGSELNFYVRQRGAKPLVFSPSVDFSTLADPSIIDAFWRKSVFFWSEEHALEFLSGTDYVDGNLYTLEQSTYSTKIVQGALFAFK